jgi:hypothetical protein
MRFHFPARSRTLYIGPAIKNNNIDPTDIQANEIDWIVNSATNEEIVAIRESIAIHLKNKATGPGFFISCFDISFPSLLLIRRIAPMANTAMKPPIANPPKKMRFDVFIMVKCYPSS